MEQTYDACAFAWHGAALEEGEADESKRGRGEAADQETVGGSRREVWSAMSACMGESGGAEVTDVVQWRSRSGGRVGWWCGGDAERRGWQRLEDVRSGNRTGGSRTCRPAQEGPGAGGGGEVEADSKRRGGNTGM